MCHALICYSRPREHNLITPTFTCYVSDVIRLGAFRNPARGRAPLGVEFPEAAVITCHIFKVITVYMSPGAIECATLSRRSRPKLRSTTCHYTNYPIRRVVMSGTTTGI